MNAQHRPATTGIDTPLARAQRMAVGVQMDLGSGAVVEMGRRLLRLDDRTGALACLTVLIAAGPASNARRMARA